MEMHDELLRLVRPWLRLLFWLLVASIFVFALRQLSPLLLWSFNVLQPFLIALVVAYVFHPIVTFVQKKLRLGRITGIVVLLLTILLLLTGVLVWLIPVLYHQISSTISDLSDFLGKHLVWIRKWAEETELTRHIEAKLIEVQQQFRLSLDDLLTDLGAIRPLAQGGLTVAQGGLAAILSLLTSLRATAIFMVSTGFVVVIAFYYLADMDAFPHIIRKLLPVRHRERFWDILLQADHAVGGFLRGQLIACVIVAVLTANLLIFIGMKQYAILIGSFAGLMHLIPYLGPVAGGMPAILWVLLSQHFQSWSQKGLYILIILIGFSVIETFDGLVTQPYVVGKRASLHPLMVMLALAVGAQFGIGGMIIAVPVACFFRVLWMELFWKWRKDPVLDGLEE